MTSHKSGQGAMPKGDVSYLRATPGPHLPVAPSPLPAVDSNHVPVAPQHHSVNSDLQDKLELQQRELDEIRARASQMEKTMRWWSDCTSNWREKWSKVRNERNKAREENRQLRAKLDLCIKEINSLKREKEGLVNCNKDLPSAKVTDKQIDSSEAAKNTSSNNVSDTSSMIKSRFDVQSISVQTEPDNLDSSASVTKQVKETNQDVKAESLDVSADLLAGDKLGLLELKLDESQKTVAAEREEKTQITKCLEAVRQEVNSWKSKHDELNQSKHDLELQIARLKDQHADELTRLSCDLQDEQSSRNSMDRRLGDLRIELERLQKENADEWGKRERMETEKLGLERENKKLRAQVSDLEEQLERKSTNVSTVNNKDIKTLQMEVSEKNKELADLKHIHTKLKKTLQERSTDLDHSKRRCDQFEIEVKKLRSRVDELKRELATAEDEVDTQANNVRKVQRNNDELQEQVENLQVQLEHLQSRLKRSSQPGSTSVHSSSHRSFSPDMQALELDDTDDDEFSEGS